MSRIPLSVELRFLRIAAHWSRRKETLTGHYFLAPAVDKYPKVTTVEDPWSLRNDFLRMEHSEAAALEFLDKIGIWTMGEVAPYADATFLSGAFGYRFIGNERYPLPLTVEELWEYQERWKGLLKNPEKLRRQFGPAPEPNARPFDQLNFALSSYFGNTLPIHLEWKRRPHAVLQPITGHELLIATAWVDLVSGSEFQVCQKPDCGIPFTWYRKRMFCPDGSCAHVMAQRMYRKRKHEQKKGV